MAFWLSSRNVPETFWKIGRSKSSSGLTTSPVPNSVPTTRLLVSAPVGHETMHSPQETQDEFPIGRLVSNAIPAWYPLPRRASTQFDRISSHPRIQRSQRIQAS